MVLCLYVVVWGGGGVGGFFFFQAEDGIRDLVRSRGLGDVYKRQTPSRYMQGPVPGISDDEYDLPGVPWTMYFTKQGLSLIHI